MSTVSNIFMRHRIVRCAISVLVAAMLAGAAATPAASAEEVSPGYTFQDTVNHGIAFPTFTFRGASLSSGGTGMAARPQSAIQIDNMTGRVRASYIYWSYLAHGSPSAMESSRISMQRSHPNPAAQPVEMQGELIGNWPVCGVVGQHARVFRAQVPGSVVTGNGLYLISPVSPRPSASDGNASVPGKKWLPIWYGATLFVIGTGSDVVALYDGITHDANWNRLITTLRLPALPGTYQTVLLHQFGHGGGRSDRTGRDYNMSKEITSVNGFAIAGPGSPAHDSDWNGNLYGWNLSKHDVVRATVGSEYNRTRLRILLDRNGVGCPRPIGAAVAITPLRP
ncbi:hypothetical protein [Methylobrevis albus]|uniref:Uncharacterized protein n=1 Tax=Methylobrevis albus TaxID=2793297 RepID=A0A931N123_9HYPH|nr:hypothetical protein [Methylobrevis albus]MBH0239381.1 hypothetical protein [Methylobrevis albus]